MNICFYTDCGKLTCNQNHTAVMFVNLMSKLNSPAVNDDSVSTEPKIKPLQQLFPLISILSILNDSFEPCFSLLLSDETTRSTLQHHFQTCPEGIQQVRHSIRMQSGY